MGNTGRTVRIAAVSASLRHIIGVLIYDWVPFDLRLRGVGARRGHPEQWLQIRNRGETISMDERGVRCDWRFSSDLHIAKVFPSTSARLMRKSLACWPIAMRGEPAAIDGPPRLSFLIGHRGIDRLPHLLFTLRAIAGQSSVAFECIVVEQSMAPEIERLLPSWVRYVHTPLPRPELPYCRAWAFNVAARHARSDVLVFQDNDVLVPERYAHEALQRVAEGWSFIDLKRFLFYLDDDATRRVFATGAAPRGVAAQVVQNLDGGSIIARRDAYEAIGGFDESFVGWGGEDNDFLDRAAFLGGVNRFAYLPLLHLEHPPQPGRGSSAAGAIQRYRNIETVDPGERIARLRAVEQGLLAGPALTDSRFDRDRQNGA
jgi:hypothetical protein